MSPNFFKKLGPVSINQIQSTVDCETSNIFQGDLFDEFVGLNNLTSNTSLSFLYDNENINISIPLSVGLICTKRKSKELNGKHKIIIVKNVQEAVAKISNIFYRDFNENEKTNLEEPIIGKNCKIGSNVVIENGSIIGDNVIINHNAIIKNSCIIGSNTFIGANTLISNSILGDNIYISSNSSLGQRGFGFYLNNKKNINIYHTGRVILQSNVSVGAGCAIDRGSFSDTVIGENTFIDNLCHIAHNVEIGSNCAFAAMTGIAGSTKIGNNVLTGGQVGIAGHIKIGNNVKIAAKSGVFDSLNDDQSVMGNPAINKFRFIKKYKKTYG